MAGKITLSVDDTSPSITYLPIGDTFTTPNPAAGWNPFFNISGYITAPGTTGNGTSYHVTSREGASISIEWIGTGIQLFGSTAGNAGYSIKLDGHPDSSRDSQENDGLLASYLDLPYQKHSISLTTTIGGPEAFVYFDTALIVTTSPAEASLHYLKDNDISLFGNWTFETSNNVGFHRSVTKGDRAHAQFQGTSFVLHGMTSPNSGRYNVTLDNITTILSGKSSFNQDDSLLYFATGLDPGRNHEVEVTNLDGGQLSLKLEGFGVYSNSSTPGLLPTPEPVESRSEQRGPAAAKGTIAALVLAGILIFFIITGTLFYFFVVRPRRQRIKRVRLERQERRRKQREAGEVLNIGQEAAGDMEMASLEASPGHRSTSGRSGFARWKREVEGGLGGLGIGIVFRHSDSTQGHGRGPSRFEAESEPLSTKSSMFTISSKPSSKKGKGKGKKKSGAREASDSPSFAVELPARPPSSVDSQKDKDIDAHYSISSGLTPLSYMSTPVRLDPPSYTALGPDRHSNPSPPRSDPKSVYHSAPSTNNHSRTGSDGPLLNHGAPNLDNPTEDVGRGYEPFGSSLPQSDTTLRPARSFADDRGSAQYSSDEAKSILGSSATQVALRGLSPRTETIRPRTRSEETRREDRIPSPPPPLPPLPLQFQPIQASSIQRKIMESPSQWEEEENAASEATGSKGPLQVPNSLLSVRPTSPFRIDFSRSVPPPPKHKRASTRASASFVRFEDDTEEANFSKGKEKAAEEQRPESSQAPPKKRSEFRLTPPSKPRPSNPPSSRHARTESSSFLDFSSSSDASYRTQSIATSTSQSERDRTWASLPMPNPPKSRWSNTLTQSTDLSRSGTRATDFSRTTRTTELSRSDSTGVSLQPLSPASAPRSVFSGNFPYPISLPPSPHHPEGHKRTPSPPTWQSPEHARNDSVDQPSVHPFQNIASPTDSVPMSVTELKFRHSHSTTYSHSDSNSNSSILPPHPPLPGRDGEESEVGTPGLSTPQYIVQRVLGHTPSGSATSPTFMVTGPASRSDSPSTVLLLNDKSMTKNMPSR